jgi:hypothetical protein
VPAAAPQGQPQTQPDEEPVSQPQERPPAQQQQQQAPDASQAGPAGSSMDVTPTQVVQITQNNNQTIDVKCAHQMKVLVAFSMLSTPFFPLLFIEQRDR